MVHRAQEHESSARSDLPREYHIVCPPYQAPEIDRPETKIYGAMSKKRASQNKIKPSPCSSRLASSYQD